MKSELQFIQLKILNKFTQVECQLIMKDFNKETTIQELKQQTQLSTKKVSLIWLKSGWQRIITTYQVLVEMISLSM